MRLLPPLTPRDILLAILRVLVITYVFIAGWLYVKQDAMLYFPDDRPFAYCPELGAGVQVSMDGTRGYFFQNGTSSKLAILYHGNAGSACDRAYYRTAIEGAGYSWLFVEYAGYAGDGKKPSTNMILGDVKHVVAWVGTKEFSSIAVLGESIGSGPASFHSSIAPADRLMLITPFDRLSAVASRYYPYMPTSLLLKDDYDNLSWARSAKNILIVGGTGDTIIPFAHAQNLFDLLPQEERVLYVLEGVDHNEVPALGKTQYEISRFLSTEQNVKA